MADLRHANDMLSQKKYYADVRDGDGISERRQDILHDQLKSGRPVSISSMIFNRQASFKPKVSFFGGIS